MTSKKGFVTFFLNIMEYNKHIGVEEYIKLVKTQNQAVVDELNQEGYICVFVPCFNESCRVQRTNFINDSQD